ncbi:hypothetical protein QJS04_geneDACA006901 [Acorus gramineus]|uniref:Remorin C-terminal domain-containing protein n=1 Tax=Acorus gramineus TaxID=55184 RepID=A0AAV9AWW0_ACOGR|nr:hypothetical protein QJS04_geneDACA006901 [Acorus gramineus]
MSSNWSQRQLPRMSRNSYSSDGEYEMAVAGSAFAITKIEEEMSRNQMRIVEERQASMTRIKSRKESDKAKTKESHTFKSTDSKRISRWFTNKETNEVTGESSMRRKRVEGDAAADQKSAEKAFGTTPSIRRTATSTGRSQTQKPGQVPPPAIKPTVSSASNVSRVGSSYGEAEAIADAWKEAKMEKIKKRYEKRRETILSWENEKKLIAKRRLDKKEGKLELRRATALQEYRNEISNIDKIAGKARALADEKRRNDESKAREKAMDIRSKGRVPTCFCC